MDHNLSLLKPFEHIFKVDKPFKHFIITNPERIFNSYEAYLSFKTIIFKGLQRRIGQFKNQLYYGEDRSIERILLVTPVSIVNAVEKTIKIQTLSMVNVLNVNL